MLPLAQPNFSHSSRLLGIHKRVTLVASLRKESTGWAPSIRQVLWALETHQHGLNPGLPRYIYERRGRMYAGKGLGSAIEWMRAKGHGVKSQVTAASGAANILVMQANAKKQYQVRVFPGFRGQKHTIAVQ